MSTPSDADATETFAPPKFAQGLTPKPRVDVAKPDQVYDLAFRLQSASARRLMEVTHAEIRAIAALAASCAPVASQAAVLVELIGAAAKPDAITAQMRQLATVTYPLMRRV